MSLTPPAPRARVTTETRRLLGVAVIALITLWVLARLRLPEAPLTPNPVSPLLAQLAPPAPLTELARELGAAAGRVRTVATVVEGPDLMGLAPAVALRWSPGVAVVVTDRSSTPRANVEGVLAHDWARGLTLVSTDASDPAAAPPIWQPSASDAAQALVAATAGVDGNVAVEPLFITTWSSRRSPAWGGDVWTVDTPNRLRPGTFLFTARGELAGVTVIEADDVVVVPAPLFYGAVDTLSKVTTRPGDGWIGVRVAAVTPRLSEALGGRNGLLVLQLEAGSPAHDVLAPGDVVMRVNDTAVTTTDAWSGILDRLHAGETLSLHVDRNGEPRDVTVTAGAWPSSARPLLGLGLQRIDGRTQIATVDASSSAATAGLQAGDTIEQIATIAEPTPAQIRRAFAAEGDTPLLVLYSRNGVTHATTLKRR